MINLISLFIPPGTIISTKFLEVFRDENAAKKGEGDVETDVKSGKKLQ